jgi:hypothetical protein
MLLRFVAYSLMVTTATATAASAATSTAPKREVAEKAADGQEKMICKRFLETGSLVKGYRTCKTKRDWERERDAIRMHNGGGNSCPTGGIACS